MSNVYCFCRINSIQKCIKTQRLYRRKPYRCAPVHLQLRFSSRQGESLIVLTMFLFYYSGYHYYSQNYWADRHETFRLSSVTKTDWISNSLISKQCSLFPLGALIEKQKSLISTLVYKIESSNFVYMQRTQCTTCTMCKRTCIG